jgi:hypothetical protein|tara:strand:+ start:1460 stop:1891 length:432 start_codon:yes stop_codon:yes gene_type:complete
MKIQNRNILDVEVPIYVQKISEHPLHKDDFLTLMKEEKPWWENFVIAIDSYVRNLTHYFDCDYVDYVRWWRKDNEYGNSIMRQSHYTNLYFFNDDILTVSIGGKKRKIKANEGELISFPSILRYTFENNTTIGFDLVFKTKKN